MTRTLTGLAVPWGQVGLNQGRRLMFARGSLTWTDPVRFRLRHNPTSNVGRVLEFEDTAEGLAVSFAVTHDRAWSLATEAGWTGLSVGVAPGAVWDLRDDDVHHCVRARLVEVSLDPHPVFDTARLTGWTED